MTDQSGSARFETIWDSALQAYEEMTGVALAQHPLALDLQTCHSIGNTTNLLQRRARDFDDFRQKDRIMKAIKTTVSILTTLSEAAFLAGAVGLVRQEALMLSFTSLTFFFRHHSHLRKQYKLVLVFYSMYVLLSTPYVEIIETSK